MDQGTTVDKQALFEAVETAWLDLRSSTADVAVAAKDYNTLAKTTLSAFDEVDRQLTYLQTNTAISTQDAILVMDDLRREPAGQLAVAFKESKELDQALGRCNKAAKKWESMRDIWTAAMTVATAAGCESDEEWFGYPDDFVDASELIEEQAKLLEEIEALRARVAAGAAQVDARLERVVAAQRAAMPATVADAPASQPEPTNVMDDLLDDVSSPAAQGPANEENVGPAPVAPVAAQQPVMVSYDDDESLPPPTSAAPKPVKVTTPAPVPTGPKPVPVVSELAARLGNVVAQNMARLIEAMEAMEGPLNLATVDGQMADVRRLLDVLQASIKTYVEEIRHPDPELRSAVDSLTANAGVFLEKIQRAKEIHPQRERVRVAFLAVEVGRQAYLDATDAAARAAAAQTYKEAFRTAVQAFEDLKATGKCDKEYLTLAAEALDEAGSNRAIMANRAHVDDTALAGDAADWSDSVAGVRGRMGSMVKPIAIGAIALLVVVAGVLMGRMGSTAPTVATPVAAAPSAPTVPAPAVPSPVPHAALPAKRVPPEPARVAHAPAVEHHPVTSHRTSTQANEKAELDAANAKLDAFAASHGIKP